MCLVSTIGGVLVYAALYHLSFHLEFFWNMAAHQESILFALVLGIPAAILIVSALLVPSLDDGVTSARLFVIAFILGITSASFLWGLFIGEGFPRSQEPSWNYSNWLKIGTVFVAAGNIAAFYIKFHI